MYKVRTWNLSTVIIAKYAIKWACYISSTSGVRLRKINEINDLFFKTWKTCIGHGTKQVKRLAYTLLPPLLYSKGGRRVLKIWKKYKEENNSYLFNW